MTIPAGAIAGARRRGGGGGPPNLLTNGTFDTDTSGWTAVNATLAVDANRLRITNTAASAGQAWQSFATVIGQNYIVEYDGTHGTGNAGVRVGTAINGTQYGTGASGTNVQVPFTATTTTAFVTLRNGTATVGTTAFFDNVEARNN